MEDNLLAEQIVNKGIQNVVFRYNAFAQIVSTFRIVYSKEIPTLGVDTKCRLIINPEFIVKNEQYITGLLIHEILHVFMGHTNNRDKLRYTDNVNENKIINIAEDCAINQFIKEALPDGAITPIVLEKAYNMQQSLLQNETAEYYYDAIKQSDKENGKGGNSLSPLDDNDFASSQRIQDMLEKMGIENVSAEEINDRVMGVANELAKAGRGSSYGCLVDFALEMLKPKVNWKPLLQAEIRNAEKKVWNIHAKPTFKRTSRRSGAVLIPKKYGNKISVALSFDTSGSITHEMVNQFLSEVENAMRLSEIKECGLWHTRNYWYGSPEELKSNITKVFESGGTYESCMGEAEKHCKADLYIHFSDGIHGECFGFEHPNKNIEIIWDGNDIKDIKHF